MTDAVPGDHLDRAKAFAEQRVADRLSALGIEDTGGLRIECGTQGTLLAYRTRSRVGTQVSDPAYVAVMDHAPWIPDYALDTLDRNISRHARRLLRERAIADVRTDGRDPPWSYTMHRLARGAILAAGLDPALFARFWDMHRELRMVLETLSRDSGIEFGDLHIEDGRIDIHSISWRGLEIGGEGVPFVIVGQPLPETVVAALPGRLLSEAISHPAVDRAGPLRIVSADTNDNYTTFTLADVQDHVRRPPAGTDRRWTHVPFMPWSGE